MVFTLVERVTDNYIAMQVPSKTKAAIQAAMQTLHAEYGEHFQNVFKSITVDNGPEFEDFSQAAQWGTAIYFAHPYSSWERPVNERHNGLLRGFIPKGVSIEKYSPEQVLAFADEMNGRPRSRLATKTPKSFSTHFSTLFTLPELQLHCCQSVQLAIAICGAISGIAIQV